MGVGLGAGVGFGQIVGQAMAAAVQPSVGQAADDVVAILEKLHALLEKGILTQAEFDAKKAELLKKLS